MRIRDLLEESSNQNVQKELKMVLAERLNKDIAFILMNPDFVLDKNILSQIKKDIEKIRQRFPLAYIINKCGFYGRDFYVDENVLVPRPESEMIVDEAVSYCRNKDQIKILDIGTGSGCLAISTFLELKENNTRMDIDIEAIDISDAALKIAQANAKKLNADVKFKKVNARTDELSNYDLIMSNPPYVRSDYFHSSIRLEPEIALYAGSDGMDFYRDLKKQKIDTKAKRIIFEIGYDQSQAITDLFESNKIEIKKDISGHDRIAVIDCQTNS